MFNTIVKNRGTYRYFSNTKAPKYLAVCLLSVFTFSIETSWSYDIVDSRTLRNVSREALSYVPSSPVVDECIPLLESQPHNTPSEMTTGRNQRSAGKIVALGMLLGARYAHGPSKHRFDAVSEDKVQDKSQAKNVIDNRSALAITAYRQCKKNRLIGRVALN